MGSEGRLKEIFSGKFPEYGAIFMSNESTKEECFERKLFGLPMSSAGFVKGVKVGMVLFLFEYEKRLLHGVFKATSDGELNIVRNAYSSSGKKFSAQVTFTPIWDCHPLPEYEFRNAIRDNYYTTYKFNLGLSKDQVYRLLCLFGSRKIRVFRSQSFTGSNIRKGYPKSSLKKRKTEKDRSNLTKSAMKKLKGDIDSTPDSDVEPLVYSGKLTVEKDESHLLDSGDLHIVCKKSGSQSSLALVSSHSSTSGQEWVPHPDNAIQIQPVSVKEEFKELESSGNFDTDLGDFIPLLQSDDSDSADTSASPESGCLMNDHMILPFSASGLLEDTCKLVSTAPPITKLGDVHNKENAYDSESPIENCQEDNNSDYIDHKSVRGLYSDASNDRSSVFSRLKFSSGVQDREDYTDVDKSAREIMEELKQMHDKWNKTVGMPGYVERGNVENELTVNRRTSVFSRLSWN